MLSFAPTCASPFPTYCTMPQMRFSLHRLACLLCAGAFCTQLAAGAAQVAAPVAASPAPQGKTYQPKAGETLDQVIAKTMGASPLSMAILRQAFIDQNPQAIVPGKVPKLRKGATLSVPEHDVLLRSVLASVTPVNAPNAEAAPRATPSSPEERKRWVQFP